MDGQTTETRTAYRTFFYAINGDGKYQVYGPDGAAIPEMIYRSASVARAAIDTRVNRAEALAKEHAEHAVAEAKRMEREGTLTPAELIRLRMGRRENRADDLI